MNILFLKIYATKFSTSVEFKLSLHISFAFDIDATFCILLFTTFEKGTEKYVLIIAKKGVQVSLATRGDYVPK